MKLRFYDDTHLWAYDLRNRVSEKIETKTKVF